MRGGERVLSISTPASTHATSCPPLSPLHRALKNLDRARGGGEAAGRPRSAPGGSGGGGGALALPAPEATSPKLPPQHPAPPAAQGREREGCGLPVRGAGVQKEKNAAWAITTPSFPPLRRESRSSRDPAGLPSGAEFQPCLGQRQPGYLRRGPAGRGLGPGLHCGAAAPPPPLRRGRAAGPGRAPRCPPRSPRQCHGGLGQCGHLPRSPLPAAGGPGIFSAAPLFSSPKVSPTYLFICLHAPRCRRAVRAAPRRAWSWKRLCIAAGRAER